MSSGVMAVVSSVSPILMTAGTPDAPTMLS
jgi:hypothetical protein